MDNQIGINELAERYGGKLNLKHRSIYKFGKIMLLIGIAAGIMRLILFNNDSTIHSGADLTFTSSHY